MMTRRIGRLLSFACLLLSGTLSRADMPPVRTVFLIVMENQDWAEIIGKYYTPYINSLLPGASYCSQYYNPPGNHPSEANYLWLEAGTNFGITRTGNPFGDHQSTTNHLSTLLNNAGITWKAYQEDISGTNTPLYDTGNYAARHDPFVFFDDVTGSNNPTWPYAIAHIRPYTELMGDLASNTVAQYNFITPNLCDDMHNSCSPLLNPPVQGDTWLSTEIPKLTNSLAFQNNGAIFITWDEGASADGPIGMIVLSPLAKGGGYASTNHYTHSSTLRTMQEIFGVTPLLGDAANAPDLSDLFVPPASVTTFATLGIKNLTRSMDGSVQFNVGDAIPGKTNLVQMSTDLGTWINLSTNVPSSGNFSINDTSATNARQRFYRVVQMP